MGKGIFQKGKYQSGFTLVELLVVIAIIGILAAIILPNAFNAIEKSKVAAAEADYKAIKAAALNYYTDVGDWPSTGNGGSIEAQMFISGQSGSGWTRPEGWNGPYLERWPEKNPWGGYYKFVNWSDATSSPWGTIARWVELSNVPGANGDSSTGAAKRIKDDLGGDVVKIDGSLVKILISKD